MGKDYCELVLEQGVVAVPNDVLLYDDFEGQFNWSSYGAGTDWVVGKSSGGNEMMDGQYGLKLQTRTTTPAAGDYAAAYKSISVLPQKSLSWRVYFRSSTPILIGKVWVYGYYYTGSVQRCYEIYYNVVAKQWYYYGPGGVLSVVPGGNQNIDLDAWSVLEIEVSLISNVIKSIKCNNMDLKDINLATYNVGSSTPSNFTLYCQINNQSAGVSKLFLDHMLITGKV